jgi:hypothetical protein
MTEDKRMPAIEPERATDSTPDRRMKQVLWWICLLAAPLVLITIELFHPANFTASPGMYEFLSHAEHYDPTTRPWAISDRSGGSRCT